MVLCCCPHTLDHLRPSFCATKAQALHYRQIIFVTCQITTSDQHYREDCPAERYILQASQDTTFIHSLPNTAPIGLTETLSVPSSVNARMAQFTLCFVLVLLICFTTAPLALSKIDKSIALAQSGDNTLTPKNCVFLLVDHQVSHEQQQPLHPTGCCTATGQHLGALHHPVS